MCIRDSRKLEWNWKLSKSSNIWNHTIQIRPSGLRVSNPSYIPTVVSINANQIPIYGPMGRHLTKRELARAFGFPDKMKLLENSNAGFNALGNAVHVEVAKMVAKNLFSYEKRIEEVVTLIPIQNEESSRLSA